MTAWQKGLRSYQVLRVIRAVAADHNGDTRHLSRAELREAHRAKACELYGERPWPSGRGGRAVSALRGATGWWWSEGLTDRQVGEVTAAFWRRHTDAEIKAMPNKAMADELQAIRLELVDVVNSVAATPVELGGVL